MRFNCDRGNESQGGGNYGGRMGGNGGDFREIDREGEGSNLARAFSRQAGTE